MTKGVAWLTTEETILVEAYRRAGADHAQVELAKIGRWRTRGSIMARASVLGLRIAKTRRGRPKQPQASKGEAKYLPSLAEIEAGKAKIRAENERHGIRAHPRVEPGTHVYKGPRFRRR